MVVSEPKRRQAACRAVQFVAICSLLIGDIDPTNPLATVNKDNQAILKWISELSKKVRGDMTSEELRQVLKEAAEFALKILKS